MPRACSIRNEESARAVLLLTVGRGSATLCIDGPRIRLE